MKLKYLPILLLLFLFAIDKIFIIPSVRKAIVQNHVNSYEVLNNLLDKLYKEHIEKYKKISNLSADEVEKETIIFMGTSRSVEFANMKDSLFDKNPFVINAAATSRIPVTSWTIRAAPFIHIYQIYNHFINTHTRPKLVVVEVSYPSFNKNNIFKKKSDIHDFTFDEFLDSHGEFSNADKIEYLSSVFFVLNRSNINWKGLLSSGINTNTDVNATLDFVLDAKKLMEMRENQGSWMQGTKENQEDEALVNTYQKYTDWVLQSFYQNVQIDLTSFNLLKKIVREAKQKNVNLVLYRARTHSSLKKATARYAKKEEIWLQEVTKLAKENSVSFYDYETSGALECDYFVDTSHMSKSCFPEMLEKIVEGEKKKSN